MSKIRIPLELFIPLGISLFFTIKHYLKYDDLQERIKQKTYIKEKQRVFLKMHNLEHESDDIGQKRIILSW